MLPTPRAHSCSRPSPQVVATKSPSYQFPSKRYSVKLLWDAFPEWKQFGNELSLAGFDMLDLFKAAALDKLIPDSLLTTIVSRPELAD